MNVLLIHNNFPGQFLHVARALAQDSNVKVAAVGSETSRPVNGVRLLKYRLSNVDVSATHPFARRFDLECHRAEQVIYLLSTLSSSGFVPDVILAHPGWGEALPLRTIFPRARILLYCEFFYGSEGRDVGFDKEFPEIGIDGHVSLHLKNAATLLSLTVSDAGLSPTHWQKSTFPQEYQSKISVIHEGVDTDIAKPARDAVFRLRSGREFRRADEVVTFVARNIEPLRGIHIFMRALPRIMAKRSKAQIVIIGREQTYYGASAPPGKTWKSVFLDEVGDQIDIDRLHFTGLLPYDEYLAALQVSSAHVYLTYPFVLSWSLVEAMSCSCLVIGSDTTPLREVIDGTNGLLVPFFEPDHLAEKVIEVLTRPAQFRRMREEARRTVVNHFDLQRICLPKMLEMMHGTAGRPLSRRIHRVRRGKRANVRVNF
jgi:glycosyltransferase involved in cell wall biosynthesis